MAQLNDGARIEFNFEGQFLGFVSHDGKVKYIRIKMLSEEIQVKVPSAMSVTMRHELRPGNLIQVIGVGKFNAQTYELKLNATEIIPCSSNCCPSRALAATDLALP